MTDLEHVDYFKSRWQYTRPNLITLSENPGRWFQAEGYLTWLPEGIERTDYIFLSDHNRSTAPFSTDRIGTSKRMINGELRTYFVADKLRLSLSWNDIPSRAYSTLGGYADWVVDKDRCAKFTADGGAGGVEMLDWYLKHKGSCWAFLNFDSNASPTSFANPDDVNALTMKSYSRVYEMVITDFSYDVTRRSHGVRAGKDTFSVDLWDVSMVLEEV